MIGLIAAMPEECRTLLRHIKALEACRLGSFPGWQFRLDGSDCLLVQSGIGLRRAAEAARALLQAASPSLLVSFGVAGAVNNDLNIGDVVALRSVRLLDHGIPGPSLRLATLSPEAYEAEKAVLLRHGVRLVWGSALSTRGSQIVQQQPGPMENLVLEMETAAIVQTAMDYGIPCLALRGVSDNPKEPLPIDPGMVMDEDFQLRPGKLIRVLVRDPKIIFKVRRLRLNTAVAADNVAIAVIEALSRHLADEIQK